jgi:hypothetical protein
LFVYNVKGKISGRKKGVLENSNIPKFLLYSEHVQIHCVQTFRLALAHFAAILYWLWEIDARDHRSSLHSTINAAFGAFKPLPNNWHRWSRVYLAISLGNYGTTGCIIDRNHVSYQHTIGRFSDTARYGYPVGPVANVVTQLAVEGLIDSLAQGR